MSDAALVIMAKRPAVDETKSRLSPPLTPAQAAALYKRAIRELLDAEPNLTLLQQNVDGLMLDGARVRGKPAYNAFQVYGRMAAERNHFNVNLGDTIYSDSEVAGLPPALTGAATLARKPLASAWARSGDPGSRAE